MRNDGLTPPPPQPVRAECARCGGTGRWWFRACAACKGAGWIFIGGPREVIR